ncbi:hypothetical protein KAR91_41905 [Candidatus Pacearchaeota archaeon]|nr:hypothetical protein [Candidatus Pacearchaeota archaeon]
MKKIILLFLLSFTPFLATAATVTEPGDVIIERNNILPNSNLITTFSNDTTGTSSAYGLGGAKIRCHTWTIDSDKVTADVDWTIEFQGTLDCEGVDCVDSSWAVLDSTTTVANWHRDISNGGANWIRSSVLRNYTRTRPNIDIKFQSGCN